MPELVIDQRRRDLGGFKVGRVLPHARRRSVGPFVFFDHMGPVQLPARLARSADVRPHPHIGLATVTYLLAGEIMHRDSVGSEQAIRPAEVNWMTAGRGITHSERFERARREGGPMHGLQAWVALPAADEECEPAFAHHPADDLPVFVETRVFGRLIAGEAFGARAAVRTFSPLFYLHWELSGGARTALPLAAERAAYVAAGESLGPRHIEWNFVSSSRERIEQAKADRRAGRMKLPDLDHDEFVPLPGDPPPPAPPMS
ncbi:MAG TPA: pirin family protein [Ideonella sp.]|nr:pirin family protein [Ideonella sp.]